MSTTAISASSTVASVQKSPSVVRVDQPKRGGFFSAIIGWLWRFVAVVFVCFNAPILNYLTCIAAFGWFYRWMPGITLRGWWKKSRFRDNGTFREFCDSLGDDAPTSRPRWFVHERYSKELHAPTASGEQPGIMRRFGRRLSLVCHSFRTNFAIGLQGLFATFMVMGVPCLLMLFSWYYGWTNSFYKVYENAFMGALLGLGGSILFVLALFYVPLAQAHQAASGEFRAFFQGRLVWRLMRARMIAFALFALLCFVIAIILEVMRVIVLNENFFANDLALTAAQRLNYFRGYLLGYTAVLILALFVVRYVTVVIYRSAMLKVLRLGWVKAEELPVRIRTWLERLEIMPSAPVKKTGVLNAGRVAIRWSLRKPLYILVFVLWLAFVARFYFGYFLVADDFLGFVNHPLIQFPCVDYTPPHMWQSN